MSESFDSGQKILSTDDGKIRIEYANGRLVVGDETNNRLLLGFNLEGEIKIRLSKPGFDVFTATADQLILNSDDNAFKIISKGTITVPYHSVTLDSYTEEARLDTGIVTDKKHIALFYWGETGGYALPLSAFSYGGAGPTTGAVVVHHVKGYSFLENGHLWVAVNSSLYGSGEQQETDYTYYILQETAN